MVDFDVEPKPLEIGRINFRGMTAYIVESRVTAEDFDKVMDAGWCMYGIRGSDEDFGKPAEIAFAAIVNFWGLIITEEPLPLKIRENLKLTEEESESIANAVNAQDPKITLGEVF